MHATFLLVGNSSGGCYQLPMTRGRTQAGIVWPRYKCMEPLCALPSVTPVLHKCTQMRSGPWPNSKGRCHASDLRVNWSTGFNFLIMLQPLKSRLDVLHWKLNTVNATQQSTICRRGFAKLKRAGVALNQRHDCCNPSGSLFQEIL